MTRPPRSPAVRRGECERPVGLTGREGCFAGLRGELDQPVSSRPTRGASRGPAVVVGRLVGPGDGHRLVARRDAGPRRGRQVVGRAACRASAPPVPPAPPCSRAPRVRRMAAGPTDPAAVRRRRPRQATRAGSRSRRRPRPRTLRSTAARSDSSRASDLASTTGPAAGAAPDGRRPRRPDDEPGIIVELVEAHQQSRPSPRGCEWGTAGGLHQLLGKNACPRPAARCRDRAVRQRPRVQLVERGRGRRRRRAGPARGRVTPGSRDHSAAVVRSGWRRCRSSVR